MADDVAPRADGKVQPRERVRRGAPHSPRVPGVRVRLPLARLPSFPSFRPVQTLLLWHHAPAASGTIEPEERQSAVAAGGS